MRLEVHARPEPGLEGVALVVSGPPLHEKVAVVVRHHRRELEEVADQNHLLRTRDALGGEDHVHHALEEVNAAHAYLVNDDDLRLVQHLSDERLAVPVLRVEKTEADLERPVDGRAVLKVLRRDAGRCHGEIGRVISLKLLDEGVEHEALARPRVAGQEHVAPAAQCLHRLGLPLRKPVPIVIGHAGLLSISFAFIHVSNRLCRLKLLDVTQHIINERLRHFENPARDINIGVRCVWICLP